ncbi:hypothetical protein [Desulfonatronum parangueonense]
MSMLFAAVLFLAIAFFVFQAENRRPVPGHFHGGSELPPIMDQKVEQLLSRNGMVDMERYVPIVADNLFSPERRPWTPPLTVGAPPPPPSTPPLRTSNIRLYGTQVSSQNRVGIFYFGDLSGNNKHRLLREGERVWDGEAGDGPSFEVVSIEKENAILVDTSGRSFEISLYDHHRVAARRDGELPPGQQGPTIISSPSARHKDQAGIVSPSTFQGDRSTSEGDSSAEPQDAPPPLIPIQNHEEMEQLVEEGKMRKIMTPFGPIYRPIPQQTP